jgi:hypothetical protein
MTDSIAMTSDRLPEGCEELTDGEFLAHLHWRRNSDGPLTEAADAGDVEKFTRRWLRVNRSRWGRMGAPRSVLWSQTGEDASGRGRELMTRAERLHNALNKKKKESRGRSKARLKKLAAWIAAARAEAPLNAFESLLLLEVLQRIPENAAWEPVWSIWRATLESVLRISAVPETDEDRTPADVRLMTQGELPFIAGLVFSDVKGSGKQLKRGREVLQKDLDDHTDTDGTPNAELLDRLSLWIAPLVRAAEAAERTGCELWDEDGAIRFELLIEVVAPFCRADGRLPLTNGRVDAPLALLTRAAELCGMSKQRPARRYLKALGGKRSKIESRGRIIGVTPVTQSDWAELACLRSSWDVDAHSLLVAHHEQLPWIDLAVRGRSLIRGPWGLELLVDDEPVPLSGEWECVCWHSDEDGDYLELQLSLESGLTIDRQAFLSRTDDFLVLAEAVQGAGGNVVDCRSRLPLFETAETEAAQTTREVVLTDKGVRARVFPLGLPQNRVESTAGGFGRYDGQLVLKQMAEGSGLYAPLVIDWKRGRKPSPVQWRTLTVSGDGRRLRGDEAAGHRLRIGKHHLFLYRSLCESDQSRAVLGHHTFHETIIGRFSADGDVTPLLVVE